MRYLVYILLLVFLSACENKQPEIIKEVKYIEKECPKIAPCAPCHKSHKCTKIYKSYEKTLLGEVEKVYFPAAKVSLDARIDTGAKTSSLHALNIVSFERDGKNWVRFEIVTKDKKTIMLKRPVLKTIRVKQHGQNAQERYVVKMRVNISNLSQFIDISLTNREKYEFPVLIGRNYLKGNAFVDVSKKYTQNPTKEVN